MQIAIGADIGGSHISCMAIDLDHEVILENTISEIAVDNHASSTEILNKWGMALSETMDKVSNNTILGIGMAMPGPFDYEKGIGLFKGNAKFEQLYGVNVSEGLKAQFPTLPDLSIRFINDATAFALGESWLGNGKTYNRIMALTLGTGFGSAFIENGIPVLEGEGIPEMGCLWHLPFQQGIADDYISTRWFISEFKAKTGLEYKGVKEIIESAMHKDVVLNLFETFGTNLAILLTPYLKNFSTESLIIGGNIAGAYDLFVPVLEQELIKNEIQISIQLSELKESAAMIGAAKLINQEFWNKVSPLVSKM